MEASNRRVAPLSLRPTCTPRARMTLSKTLRTHLIVSVLLLALISAATDAKADRWAVHEQRGQLELFSEFPVSVDTIERELAGVAAELNDRLQLKGTGQVVQVVIFNSLQSYRDYLAGKIPEARSRRAIFYQRGEQFQIYTFRNRELITDLRHEYTHALLHQSLPYVPLWIDEGLAEFFEERPADREKSSRLSSMRWKCRTGWKPSLESLEKIPSAASMNGDNYRDSWAYVHYLLMESDRTQNEFKEFLQAISAGAAPGRFSEWSSRRETEVVNRIGSYFRRIQFSLR
ncbi:MAG: hypothetical protein WAO83_10970 [Fuerstiella sp.]